MKTETELLNDYVSERFPETKKEHYHVYRDTMNFKLYQLRVAKKELKRAIVESLPHSVRRLLPGEVK